ncbi:unnamed protein product, partial [Rotaria sp. Silwood1]
MKTYGDGECITISSGPEPQHGRVIVQTGDHR